ncbi:MAG: serine/threonine-protein kinase [Castellaniella sp.]|uniref:protein kinase domain-containing protein n=1 Tax=Castellaniella sp. TaxID=1955812 RepID=UPI003C77B54C
MKFQPGEIVAKRYRVDGFHLKGGMQEVYRCFDLALDRVVALKTPREGIIDKRFNRGAQMGARVVHPNVAATLDYVEEGAHRCLVEEFIEGSDLGRRLLNDFVFLDPSLAAWIVSNMARGIQAAHKVKICHRDLKPSNIMTSSDGHMSLIKLTDFGIAKLAEKELESEIEKFGQDENTLTSSNTLLGAVPYLAPECWVDWSSSGQPADIWAFGAIAYHLLLGKPPFGGGKGAIMAMARAQLAGKVELSQPGWFGKHKESTRLEQELWTLVENCLQVDPARRLTADEVVERCQALCYSVSPRKVGVIKNYPYKYRNGGTAKAGFIEVDGEGPTFFHSSEFFGAGVNPKVGQRVSFGSVAGVPRDRCSPVLLLRSS